MRYATMLAIALLTAGVWASAAGGAESGSPVTVRFPAFALSPGERISGVTLTSSGGRIFVGGRPNRWICDNNSSSVHCYCLHQQYATAISGMLPEFIIRGNDQGSLALQASVEFIDNNGKEYSREIREGDLIVK